MDHGFCPFERCGGLVVRFDELVNRLAQLLWRRETHAPERLLAQDAEPTFHLIQPRGIGGGEMQVDFGMALQPPIVFGLVSVQVVQHDVHLAIRVGGHDLIHEVQKFPPPSPVVVPGNDLAGGDRPLLLR
jgi:hypothetical protein